MKREELDAIRKRAEAATPGPWRSNAYGIIAGEECVIWSTSKGTVEGFDNNVRFILNARQDVPALLAEVERLSEQLSKLICAIYEYEPNGTYLMDLAEAIDSDEEV